MRVLYAHQVEVFFPVRTFFLQRCRTVANLDPTCGLVRAKPGVVHVTQIFTLRNGPFAEGFVFDGLQQIAFATGFNTGSDEITHKSP